MSFQGIEDIDDYLRDKEIYQKIILFPARRSAQVSHSLSSTFIEDVKKILTCPICKCYLEDALYLSCSHRFCRECFEECQTTSIGHKCPKCRRNVLPFSNEDPILNDITQLFQQFIQTCSAETSEQDSCLLKRGPTQQFLTDEILPQKKRKLIPTELQELNGTKTQVDDLEVNQRQVENDEAINFYKNDLSHKDMQMFIQIIKGNAWKQSVKSQNSPSTVSKEKKESSIERKKEKKIEQKELHMKESEQTHFRTRISRQSDYLVQKVPLDTKENCENSANYRFSHLEQSCFQKKGFCKISLEGLPGRLHFNIGFREMICGTAIKTDDVRSLIAQEIGIKDQMVVLYYYHESELNQIIGNKSIQELFCGLTETDTTSLQTTSSNMIKQVSQKLLCFKDDSIDLLKNKQLYGKIYYEIKTVS